MRNYIVKTKTIVSAHNIILVSFATVSHDDDAIDEYSPSARTFIVNSLYARMCIHTYIYLFCVHRTYYIVCRLSPRFLTTCTYLCMYLCTYIFIVLSIGFFCEPSESRIANRESRILYSLITRYTITDRFIRCVRRVRSMYEPARVHT